MAGREHTVRVVLHGTHPLRRFFVGGDADAPWTLYLADCAVTDAVWRGDDILAVTLRGARHAALLPGAAEALGVATALRAAEAAFRLHAPQLVLVAQQNVAQAQGAAAERRRAGRLGCRCRGRERLFAVAALGEAAMASLTIASDD